MIYRLLTILLALGLGAFLLAGCSSTGSEPEPEVAQTSSPAAVDEAGKDLLTHEWHLEAFGKLGEENEIAPGTSITLNFDQEGALSGNGGCNRYSTTFRTGPSGEIGIRALAMTQMECADATMVQERAYLGAVGDVTSYDVGAGRLQLFYGDDEYALLFKGQPKDEAESSD